MNETSGLTEKTPASKRRLNPFAFPPETNAFFTLLVVTVLIWMLELGQLLALNIGQDSRFQVILVILVFLFATAIYLSHPTQLRRRKNLRQVAREEDPKFMDAVQELVGLSQISSPPSIEMAARSHATDGQAFGVWKNYSLRLGGRLRLLLRREPASFRAIVLHELAHIANQDIPRVYFTQALWIAVLSLAVLPVLGFFLRYFLQTFTNSSGLDMFPIVLLALLKIGCSLLLITAIFSNLLRSREFYADWRTALWGAGEALANILHRTRIETTERRRWRSVWNLHPTARERLEVIQDPKKLFFIKPALAFFVGVLPGLMLGVFSQVSPLIQFLAGPITYLEQVLGPNVSTSAWSLEIAAILFLALLAIPGFFIIYLITNSLGLAVQRETVARMDSGQEGRSIYLSLWKPAIVAAIGFQVGALLTLSSILQSIPDFLESPEGRLYLVVILILTVLLTILLAIQTWIGFIYVSVFTRQLLGSHVGKSPPVGKMRLLTLALAILLLMFYLPMVFVQEVIGGASGLETSTVFQWLQAAIRYELAAIFVYILVFAVTGVLVRFARLNRKQRCPACAQVTVRRFAVGQSCEHCGNELAPWLYIT